MSTRNKQHPSSLHLAALALGKLKPEMAAEVQSHLEYCGDCRRYVSDTPPDELAKVLREVTTRPAADQNTAASALSATIAGSPSPGGKKQATDLELRPSTPSRIEHAVSASDVPHDLFVQTKYRILRVLGRGGMGTVYEGEHLRMQRPVAIKVINPDLVDQPQALMRFEEESKAVALLNHENIARAYDAESFGKLQALIMEFVRGQTLSEILKARKRLSSMDACRCIRQAMLGLQHAFEKGLVHRDLKLQNLMLERSSGKIKILDFGLAKTRERQGKELTGANKIMGTLEYMAPEQWRDCATADIRADIYSLGCSLYYLIAGVLPFEREGLLELHEAHLKETPKPLHEICADVPRELSDLVASMLAKDPSARPQTPREVAEALLPFARGGATFSSVSALEPQAKSVPVGRRLNKRMWGGIAATLLALVGIGGWAAGIFSVRTPNGTITIDGVPNDADVSVDGQTVNVIRNGDSLKISAVAQGAHHLKILQDGHEIGSDDVTISMAGQLLNIQFKRNAASVSHATSIAKSPNERVTANTSNVTRVDGKNSGGAESGDSTELPASAPTNRTLANSASTKVVGQCSVTDHELVVISNRGFSGVIFGDRNWADYDLHYKVCRTSGIALMGCDVRQDSKGSWINFSIGRNNEANAHIGFKAVGQPGYDQYSKGPSIELGRWYDIEIKCRASEFYALVDGRDLFGPISRTDVKRGAVRLWATGNGTIRFKDIRVTAPNGDVLWNGLPDVSVPPRRSEIIASPNDVGVDETEAENLSVAANSEGFRPLFNGRDLTGWKKFEPLPGTWKIENGKLIGRAISHLYSVRDDYRNVHLRVKLRLSEKGRFCLYQRAEFGTRPGTDFVNGLELTYGTETANHKFLYADGTAIVSTGPNLPANKLTQVDFVVRGGHVTVSLDGNKAFERFLPRVKLRPAGRIVLQSQRGDIEFESVEVKELPEPDPTEPVSRAEQRSLAKSNDTAALFPPNSLWRGKWVRFNGEQDATARVIDVNESTVLIRVRSVPQPGLVRVFTCKVDGNKVSLIADDPAEPMSNGPTFYGIDVKGEIVNGILTIAGTEDKRGPKGREFPRLPSKLVIQMDKDANEATMNDAVQAAHDGLYNQTKGLSRWVAPETVGQVIKSAIDDAGKQLPSPIDALVAGELCMVGGRADAAETAIRAAIKAGGAENFYFKSLGITLLAQKKVDEARKNFEEALKNLRQADGKYDLTNAGEDALTAAYFLDLLQDQQYIDRMAGNAATASFPWFYVAQRHEIESKKDSAIAAYKQCVERVDKARPHFVVALARWRLAELEKRPAPSKESVKGKSDLKTDSQNAGVLNDKK
jgi:serine/threonine protein kinase